MAVHGILGKKIGMTQIFGTDGTVFPVTVVQAGPCLVVQKKTAEKDGYESVQIGLVESRPDRRANRAEFPRLAFGRRAHSIADQALHSGSPGERQNDRIKALS